MFWHIGIQAVALALFTWPTWKRWRNWLATPTTSIRLTTCLAATLLLVGSAIGGYLVYHGGAGIDPRVLAPEVGHGHPHSDPAEHDRHGR